MNIIVIGCGKVGVTLADMLVREGHNVVMVDKNAEKLSKISEDIDAIRLVGNGASITTQIEAGIKTADVFISVTAEDELNLLCCLIARRAGHCHTIARVRNPIYSNEIGFIKEQMGISMIINPELAAATEISKVLRFPSAIQIDSFAKNRIELLKFRLKEEFGLAGQKIMDIDNKLHPEILFCGVERGDEVFIPSGQFVLENGDKVSIIASPEKSAAFFHRIGLQTNQVKSTMIIGGSTISYYLAGMLEKMNIRVKIVERDRDRCENLSEKLENTIVIHGDGTDQNLLIEEGLANTESFVTLTNIDEENIFLSMFARDNSSAKLVTKVNRLQFDELIGRLDLGSVIYPKYITADYILQYVRAMQNSFGSNIETLHRMMDDQAEALEFKIRDNFTNTDIPLSQLPLKKGVLVGGINRNGRIILPRGSDVIRRGDTVVIITTLKGLNDISDVFE